MALCQAELIFQTRKNTAVELQKSTEKRRGITCNEMGMRVNNRPTERTNKHVYLCKNIKIQDSSIILAH